MTDTTTKALDALDSATNRIADVIELVTGSPEYHRDSRLATLEQNAYDAIRALAAFVQDEVTP